MSFLGGVFTGSNPTLKQDTALEGQQGGFDTGEGEGDITAGTSFLKDVLSGDASKTSQALAPEISAAKTSAQQNNETAAQMGTRSGGTAASTAATNDKVHAQITNLIGQLTGKAATALPSIGTNLTAQGTAATNDQAALSQEELENQKNSLLGNAITGAADYGESFLPVAHGG